jgi:hypothetical protein
MDLHILTILAGLLAAIFLVLFVLAMIRRGRPEAPTLFRSSTGVLGLAGMILIAAGLIAHGDIAQIASGFMFIVFATGVELGPNRRPNKVGD